MTGCGDRTPKVGVKLQLGHQDGPHSNLTHVPLRGDVNTQRDPVRSQRGGRGQAKERDFWEAPPADTLTLDFQTPEL